MNIIMCGRGALAEGFLEACRRTARVESYSVFNGLGNDSEWETRYGGALTIHRIKGGRDTIGVHAGSGSQFAEFVKFCEQTEIPLLQASTGMAIPTNSSTVIVDAPNLALPIVATLKALPKFWEEFGGLRGSLSVKVIESHQAQKQSVPGTARKFALIFGIPEKAICSIRSAAAQILLGVKNEGRHGYHWINISGAGVNISIQTKVDGVEAYASGGIIMAEKILARYQSGELAPGLYEITDFPL